MRVLHIIFFTLLYNICHSQNINLTGTTVDSETKSPVPLVEIYLISELDTLKQKSNFSGEYKFDSLELKKYRLVTNFIHSYVKSNLVIDLTEMDNNFDIELKSRELYKQTIKSKIKFELYRATSSHTSYKYIIYSDSIKLVQEELIPDPKAERKILKNNTTNFVHIYSSKEKDSLKNIIKQYKLDSVALYEKRISFGGTQWEIEIIKDAITYKIDLPNYHNQGLEELLNYVAALIPREKKHEYTF